jgi:hypothetical protein
MIKSGTIKSVLLLACIGIIIIGLAEPIAGDTMGKGKVMEQEDKMAACPANETKMKDDSTNKTMMPYMMVDADIMVDDSNKTMMPCMMVDADVMVDDSNKIMMPCMMVDDSNKTMMPCMMVADPTNKTIMMHCMMGEDARSAQTKLDCARLHLQKAMKLHEMHMKDSSKATDESMEMMHYHLMEAYGCIEEENMTMGMAMEMMNATSYHDYDDSNGSEEWMVAISDDKYNDLDNKSKGC